MGQGRRGGLRPTYSSRSRIPGRLTTATTPASATARSTQINQSNVKHLTLAWMTRVTSGTGDRRRRPAGRRGGGGAPRHRRRRGNRRSRRRRRHHQGLRAGGRWHPVLHHARQCLGRGRARRPRAVALLLEDQGRHAHRQSRPGHVEQLPVHGDARRLPGLARCARPARSAGTRKSPIWPQGYFSTPAPVVVGNHVLVGTGNDIDAPGFLQSFDPETGDLQWKFYTVPMKTGDPGTGHLGQPGRGPPRRRPDLDSRRLRSRDEALHLRHRQSDAGVHHGHARRRRQSVHLRAGRGERGHRQDGLVFPDLAARHARLRFRADARPGGRHVQRQNAQAGVDGRAQRLLLHAGSRHRRAPGDQQVRVVDQLGQGPEQDRRARSTIPERMPRWPARWCRRPPTAPSIGSRRLTLPTPACSMSRRAMVTRSSI